MPSMPFKTAGPLTNRLVMEDRAWRQVVGLKPYTEMEAAAAAKAEAKKKAEAKANGEPEPEPEPKGTALNREERDTLSVIAGWTYTHDGKVRTGDLVAALTKFLDCQRDAVMRVLRDLEAACFVRQVQNDEQGNIYNWMLREDKSVHHRLDRLVNVLERIDEMIAIQRKNPENPEAGKDLLPEGIYFNIVANRDKRRSSGQA